MRHLILLAIVGGWMGRTVEAAPIDFAKEIRPILSDKCIACHGPDAQDREADLRLDDEASVKGPRDAGIVIVPGDPTQSLLMTRVTGADGAEKMPPPDSGKELTAEEIAKLRQWIVEGAIWKRHWAYERPRWHAPPAHSDAQRDWSRHWIDRFLLAAMEAADLQPAPDADPRTVARRLAFDLTGLPATMEQVATFQHQAQQDSYDTAVSQLADQLLASPAFGERLAIYWLDLVRYADTVGYHGDQDHNISPYRDYVIDALNESRPFDQFTVEQLAGDLLPGEEIDHQIASGYNRLLQTTHEGGLQPKEYLAIYAADRVRNVSLVWMGATLGCAQCHDHKFDPYTTGDFYRMAAFFADIDEEDHFKTGTNELPTKRHPERLVHSRVERDRLDKQARQIAQLQQALAQTTSEEAQQELRNQIERMEGRRAIWQQQIRSTMITVALQQPRVTRILPRGNWLDETGPVVEPAVPEFMRSESSTSTLPSGSASEPASPPSHSRATRLELAHWLTDPQHGSGLFTARVLVNRLWYLFFGSGLCRSLDDFGGQGEAPDHPELLDRLALDLVEHDWDLKRTIRMLVTSRAYRQSSVVDSGMRSRDPENRWLARQNRYRLPAESVRDMALAVSGLLHRQIGGPSIRPYQPADYYRHLNFPERTYQHDTNSQQWRRGVYVHWQRQFLHPTFRSLDAPSREECTAQRARSNTPLAALAMLNDPTFIETARYLATQTVRNSSLLDDDQRLDHLFGRVLQRPPDAMERAEILKLLRAERHYYAEHSEEATRLMQIGMLAPPEEGQGEIAAWTSVLRALLNLHETLTRD